MNFEEMEIAGFDEDDLEMLTQEEHEARNRVKVKVSKQNFSDNFLARLSCEEIAFRKNMPVANDSIEQW